MANAWPALDVQLDGRLWLVPDRARVAAHARQGELAVEGARVTEANAERVRRLVEVVAAVESWGGRVIDGAEDRRQAAAERAAFEAAERAAAARPTQRRRYG